MSSSEKDPNSLPPVDLRLSGSVEKEAREQIERRALIRAATPSFLGLKPFSTLEPKQVLLADAVEEFRREAQRFGSIEITRKGWRGFAEGMVKRTLRKLMRRPLDQSRDVHAAMLMVLQRLSEVREAESALADLNNRRITEEVLRRSFRDEDA